MTETTQQNSDTPVQATARHGNYLVLVDDNPEFERALRFACRRSTQLGARISLLRVIEPVEAQAWLATEDLVREERVAEAEAAMEAAAATVMDVTGKMATLIVREGKTISVLEDLCTGEDFNIMSLVLASGPPEQPGALISRVSQFAPKMRFATVILPYTPKTDESQDIEAGLKTEG